MADWILVYATDAAGAAVSGSLDELHRAATRGGDIKVAYSPSSGIWWSRYCASVRAWGAGGGKRVAATYADALDTDLVAGGALGVNRPLQLEYHVYNSDGFRSFVRFNLETRAVHSEFRQMAMRWYARDYRVPLLRWAVGVLDRIAGIFRPNG